MSQNEDLLSSLYGSECPALTFRRSARSNAKPIVWARAEGDSVWDADGRRYFDFSGGFGVSLLAHRHPAIEQAITAQLGTLWQALGDLHPSDQKVRLINRLSSLAPWPNARVILGNSGADSVDAAIKTVALASQKPGMLTLAGGYHGLSTGPLSLCGYAEKFRRPFAEQLNHHVSVLPFPEGDGDNFFSAVKKIDLSNIGGLILEPIQGRGGVRELSSLFASRLNEWKKKNDILLIADEIFTGLGRCGSLFQSVEIGLDADVVTVGKPLGGGMPISACLAKEDVMHAWSQTGNEAIHTGTFFGNPLSSAAALAFLDMLTSGQLDAINRRSAFIRSRFDSAGIALRGAGLMLGVYVGPGKGLEVMAAAQDAGLLMLPAGMQAEVVQLVPPLCIRDEAIEVAVSILEKVCVTN